MDTAPAALASRLSVISETSDKLRESIDGGFLQDTMRHAFQLNHLTSQMASEWCANAQESRLRAAIAHAVNVTPGDTQIERTYAPMMSVFEGAAAES